MSPEAVQTSPAIASVVAAAGASRRMGRAKPLLAWGKSTVIETIVDNLLSAKAAPCVCVVGHKHQAVQAVLRQKTVCIAYNERYATQGLLASYQLGIATLLNQERHNALPPQAGALLALVDQPHLPFKLYERLVEAARRHPKHLHFPSFQKRRGHPFYLPRHCWPRLLKLREPATMRDVLAHYRAQTRFIGVGEDGILLDIDTPEDYQRLRARFEST